MKLNLHKTNDITCKIKTQNCDVWKNEFYMFSFFKAELGLFLLEQRVKRCKAVLGSDPQMI